MSSSSVDASSFEANSDRGLSDCLCWRVDLLSEELRLGIDEEAGDCGTANLKGGSMSRKGVRVVGKLVLRRPAEADGSNLGSLFSVSKTVKSRFSFDDVADDCDDIGPSTLLRFGEGESITLSSSRFMTSSLRLSGLDLNANGLDALREAADASGSRRLLSN